MVHPSETRTPRSVVGRFQGNALTLQAETRESTQFFPSFLVCNKKIPYSGQASRVGKWDGVVRAQPLKSFEIFHG